MMRAVTFSLLFAFVLVGCGGGGGGSSSSSTPPPTASAPVITTQPTSQTVALGANNAGFTIAATGGGVLTYQWRFNGTAISGATSSSFNIALVSAASAGSYDCVVTNTVDQTSSASTTSTAATLQVVTAPGSAALSGENAVLPNSANHSVTTSSSPGATYAWTITNGTLVSGQGTDAITYTAGHLGRIQVTVTVTNIAGTAVAVKNVIVAASLPIVSIFAPSNVLLGTPLTQASTPAAAGQTYAWTLTPGSTAASLSGPVSAAVLGYSVGGTTGSYQLTVNVADSAGRTGSATRPFWVVSDQFMQDPHDIIGRSLHTATVLNDGRVLVVGGNSGLEATNGGTILSKTDLFDPATATWFAAPPLATARYEHTATLLDDGRVLVVGGSSASGVYLSSVEIYDPTARSWSAGPSLNTARASHTATLLADGRVLVAGGMTASAVTASAEIYDPVANSWSSAGNMTTPRELHAATLLANGQVLVAGGLNDLAPSPGSMASAERYDPTSNSWTAAASMLEPENSGGAVLLVSGKVLQLGASGEVYDSTKDSWQYAVSPSQPQATIPQGNNAVLLADGTVFTDGGFYQYPNSGFVDVSAGAQIYDPISQTAKEILNTGGGAYSTASALQDGRVLVVGGVDTTNRTLITVTAYDPAVGQGVLLSSHAHAEGGAASVILADGRVVATGGFDASGITTGAASAADIFTPATGLWTSAASMASPRQYHTASILSNGRMLVVGGNDGMSTVFASAELYDPTANTWSSAGNMATARYAHTATVLGDGSVLVAGGSNRITPCSCTTFQATAELFNPTSGAWTTTGSLVTPRLDHTATLLPGGKVLVVGGVGGIPSTTQSSGASLTSTEIYDPSSGTWSAGASLNTPRTGHTATLLPSGKVLVTGGSGTVGAVASAEVYDPVANTWTVVASMATARQGHSAGLMFNGTVLVAGGTNAEVYNPVTNTWSSAGELLVPRTSFVLQVLQDNRVLLSGGSADGYAWPEFYHY